MYEYTWKQMKGFVELVNLRRTEEAKGVAYITRLAYHGEDKIFDRFMEGTPTDGY